MKVAAFPLNLTEVAPVRVVPVITTLVPTGPLAGPKPVIAGATVKLLVLVPVPPAVVIEIFPVVAAAGTVAVTWVTELTVKLALAPLNVTELAPVTPFPLITTLVPTGPLVGVKLEIVGVTAKFVVLVAVPPPVTTEILPVVAATGTVAVT